MLPGSAVVPLIGHGVGAANALLEWLMTYAIHSTLLIGTLLGLSGTGIGRRLVSTQGTWLWRFALIGAVISASLQSLRSSSPLAGTLRLDQDTPARTMVRMEVTRDEHSRAGVVPTGTGAQSWTSPAGDRVVTAASIDIQPLWPLAVLGAWILGVVLFVTLFLVARLRFLRSIGPRREGGHSIAGASLRHLCRETGLRRPVRLTLSDRLTSPVALDGCEICLPARALADLDPIRMESILAHELAHIVRHDPGWLTLARLIEVVFFFQPLNRIARRRMQEAAEFASDAWASTRVARPLDLAHCLARVAEWTVSSPRLPVPAMAERRGTVLVRRVERLTTGRVVPEVAPGRRTRLGAALALLALVLVAPRAAVGAERQESLAAIGRSTPQGERMVFVGRSPGGTVVEGQAEVITIRVAR